VCMVWLRTVYTPLLLPRLSEHGWIAEIDTPAIDVCLARVDAHGKVADGILNAGYLEYTYIYLQSNDALYSFDYLLDTKWDSA
jgi:hypothetical protein